MSRERGGGTPPTGGTPGDSEGGTPSKGRDDQKPRGRPRKASVLATRESTESTPPRARPRPTPRWQEPFLQMLSATRDVTKSSMAVHIDRKTAYNRKANDEEFSHAWDEIMSVRLRDDLRASLFQLGVVGFVEETAIQRSIPAKGDKPERLETETRRVTRIYPNVTELLARTHLPEVREAVGRQGVGSDPSETARRIREFLALADATVPAAPAKKAGKGGRGDA